MIVFFWIFHGLGMWAHAQSCDVLQKRFERIREDSTHYDVSYELTKFRKDAGECGVPVSQFGTETEISAILRAGQNVEIAGLFAEAGRANQERQRDLFDRLERFGAKHGLDDATFRERLNAERQAFDKRVTAEKQRIEGDILNSCKKPIDLSDKFPPIRDQDSIGWCYAFAAADLLSFQTGEEVSAFDMALGYNSQRFQDGLRHGGPGQTAGARDEGGFTSQALDAIQKKGYCVEKDLPSFINGQTNIRDALEGIEVLASDKRLATNEKLVCDIHNRLGGYFPNLSLGDFKDIVSKTSSQDVLNKLAERSCRRKPAPNFKVHNIFYPNVNFNLQTELQKSLEAGRPVGISVNMKSIMAKNEDAYHAMTVVGQEFNPKTGECDFIVRNSWGNVCSPFNAKVQCERGIVRIPGKTMVEITNLTTELQ